MVTYTKKQIKVQEEKYEKAVNRYLKAAAKESKTPKEKKINRKRTEELSDKGHDEYIKLKQMKAAIKKTSLKKDALAYLKKHGYTGLISGEFLAKKEELGVTLSELKTSHLDLMIQADKEAKAKEKERKRKDIIGKQNRAIAKKKKKIKEEKKEVTTTQIEQRQSQRTKRARLMDSKKRAKSVVEPDRYRLWIKHPNRYDIEGVDT